MASRVALLVSIVALPTAAFVPLGAHPQGSRLQRAPWGLQVPEVEVREGSAPRATTDAATPWSTCILAGLGFGYALAATGASMRQGGRAVRTAEAKPRVAPARTPVAYPIFTFRWLAVHALTIPTVFFLGAISSMQFIQR